MKHLNEVEEMEEKADFVPPPLDPTPARSAGRRNLTPSFDGASSAGVAGLNSTGAKATKTGNRKKSGGMSTPASLSVGFDEASSTTAQRSNPVGKKKTSNRKNTGGKSTTVSKSVESTKKTGGKSASTSKSTRKSASRSKESASKSTTPATKPGSSRKRAGGKSASGSKEDASKPLPARSTRSSARIRKMNN